MKKLSLLTVFFVACLLLFNTLILVTNVSANPDNITIIVNGEVMEFGTDANDPYPYIKEGRTLIPFRRIFEKLQMEVTWDNKTRTVHAKNETTVMELTIGQKAAIVNGIEHTLDVAPEITDDRTFVPLRFVSESVGAEVDWDAATRTVIITYLVEDPTQEIPGGPGEVKTYKLGEQVKFGDKVFTIEKIGERDDSGLSIITGSTNFSSRDMYVEIYPDAIGVRPTRTRAVTSKVSDNEYHLRIYHYQPDKTPIWKIVVLIPDENGNEVAVAVYKP